DRRRHVEGQTLLLQLETRGLWRHPAVVQVGDQAQRGRGQAHVEALPARRITRTASRGARELCDLAGTIVLALQSVALGVGKLVQERLRLRALLPVPAPQERVFRSVQALQRLHAAVTEG